MRIIAVIAARGGSKGVPNKNVRLLRGKPLIHHTIEQLLENEYIADIVVSSDSDLILEKASLYPVHCVKRPIEMASDTAAKHPGIIHAVSAIEEKLGIEFDAIMDFDATSPLRNQEDINAVIKLLEQDVTNIITGNPSHRSPYFNMVELNKEGVAGLVKPLANRVVRRQDAPICYDMNASIYAWKRANFFTSNPLFQEKTRLYVMPVERSIDIDTELDFRFVEFLMEHNDTVCC